uniref:Intraflagellar transport protein 80 homolog n=1 Tax=Meloidogyne javanica TaxID=6303 RepID=A0A915MED8_MELJA
MRLRIKLSPALSSHTEAVNGVDWLNTDEGITISDDHLIKLWILDKMESMDLSIVNVKELSDFEFYCKKIFPTSLQLSSHSLREATSKQANNPLKSSNTKISTSKNFSEIFLVTTSDGKIYLLNLNGKLEKIVDAHHGATIMARWNNSEPGGAGGGEDGCVKIWSKNGMLRSVLAQIGKPVYSIDWNGDSSKLLYCAGDECFIKQLNVQSSPIKWRAHTGLVTCLGWSAVNDQILTGGEDCRYRLWNGQGRPLWSSSAYAFPISSVAWSHNGTMFAVGSFNLLRLCDKSGWSHSMERPNCGSINCLSWSPDCLQLIGGSASGQLLHAHIVEKRLIWEQLEAIQINRRTINIRDLSSEVVRERLETKDRIIKMEIGFNYLIVATSKQLYIFSAKNWNTPIVNDLREGSGLVSLIRLCEKCFLLVDSSSVQVLNYEGKLICNIKISSFGEPFNEQTAAIANDLVVLRDKTQHSLIHLFDPQNGRVAGDGEIKHLSNIVELCVNQCGGIVDRRIIFLDMNGDCFIALVNRYGAPERIQKIGGWKINFIGNIITIRRADGSLFIYYIPPLITALINSTQHHQWEKALKICNSAKEEFLWATLAGLALAEKSFTIAEICYGQLKEAEKLVPLAELRSQPNPQLRSFQIALFGGRLREAESALLKSGHFFRAIMLNLSVFRFERALELALNSSERQNNGNKEHLDTVIGYRQRYLDLLVEVDWPHIFEKIRGDNAKDQRQWAATTGGTLGIPN